MSKEGAPVGGGDDFIDWTEGLDFDKPEASTEKASTNPIDYNKVRPLSPDQGGKPERKPITEVNPAELAEASRWKMMKGGKHKVNGVEIGTLKGQDLIDARNFDLGKAGGGKAAA